MAKSILYEIITDVSKKLNSMALQEIGQAWGVKDELDKLKNPISVFTAVLADAEEKEATNHEVADWLETLNDTVYDADHLLEAMTTQNKRPSSSVRNFFSSSNPLLARHKMTREIKAIRERLYAIAEERNRIHLIERPIEMRVENMREKTNYFVDANSVIGRDGDKMAIIQLLLDSNVEENVSVVSIVGIGGLGKTTLAQLVFNDERITKYFDLKMWVCVSDPFDVNLIAQEIIGSEAGEVLEEGEELRNHLRTKINGKKYLLVLDDVWNENRDKWLELYFLLMDSSRGSKILATTQSELVANSAGTNSPYFLKGLSKDESWSLFKRMAFKQMEEYRHTSKVEIGKEIVEKCKGVPLAIKAIGSLLYSEDTIGEWLLVKNNDLSKFEDIILPVLKLGYDHLPSSLKRCFAFCSLYWKDDEIYKNELIQMWIAHGFIRSVYEGPQLEDVGDLYFIDLLKRSFFQDVKTDEFGEIISCKMHDFVHDLARSVARFEFSTWNSDAERFTRRTRHLSFRYRVNSSWETRIHLLRANKLRTLIMKNQDLKETSFEKIVSTFKSLHVLDLSHSGMKTVPNNIGELIHLRYLDLSDNVIETLPNSVTKLQNLCTLKLNSCHGLEELPREIKKLACLRHLELDQCYALTGIPEGLGQLMLLWTLTRFVADSCSRLRELQSLNNLHGKLRIVIGRRDSCNQCLEDATAEGMKGSNYLEAKKYLKTLALSFYKNDHDDDELLLETLRPHPNLKELKIYFYRGVSFPSWLMAGLCLPNLVRIDMESCDRCIHLPLFEHLPSLQFLRIRWMRSLEYLDSSSGSGSGGEESLSSSLPSSSSSSSGGGGGAATAARRRSEPMPTFFPSLKELLLLQLHNLKGLWKSEAVEEEATTSTIASLPDQQPPPQHLKKTMPYCLPSFPYPSKLTVRDCPNLKSMPILPPYLEELHLRYVSEELVKQLFMTTESPTPTISTTTDTVSTMSSSSSSSSLLPLSNLKYLSLDSFVSLPAGLQHLTNLQTLKIEWCDNLMALPEWIGNLTSLERLEFHHCPKLTTLPDGMRQLTALQQLTITSPSNVLYDRCQKETEEDWPKIAHIPKVDIELWQ